MTIDRRFIIALIGVAAAALVNTAAAEEKTISVTIPWSAEGRIYQIGVDQLQFLGHLDGIAYAENAAGNLDEGLVSCPVVQYISTNSAKTSGRGHCTIIVSGEDSVFADFTCSGQVGGCKGEFRLTGGTGRFKGITGSSKLVIRSPLRALSVDMANGAIVRTGSGLARLPELKFSIPNK